MYGVSTREWLVFIALVAIVGGCVCIGAEHALGWAWHHVSVGFR